jgi:enoyl-CoA hydratase/carnithine racemase
MNTRVHHPAAPVLIERQGPWGLITLNRPEAMNALSLDMVRLMTQALLGWRTDAGVSAVLLRGASRPGRPPAFCAGGDIRFLHRAAVAGDPQLEDFFTEEYQLDHLIHRYPKPCVVLMDGVVMGGGMGLSQGAAVRVVTQHAQLAMPETLIGLFPDVGGGYFLSRCPGRTGEFLALTGQVLGAGDALAWGLADVMLESSGLPEAVRTLTAQPAHQSADVLAVLAPFLQAAPSASLAQHQQTIDLHFAQPTLREIVDSLKTDSSAWAEQVLAKLLACSPLMLAISLEQVRRARALTLEEVLRMERNLMHNCFHAREGVPVQALEGIRALIIDKDRAPRWHPTRIEDVTPEMVAASFVNPWTAQTAHPLDFFGSRN